MLYYFRKYPVSLILLAVISYLSFFTPPTTRLSRFTGIDKWVHACMYLGLSGILWLEFIRTHRRTAIPVRHAWIGAFLLPILFGGAVELLQEYCTQDRSGEWLDFLADCAGVTAASIAGHIILKVLRK